MLMTKQYANAENLRKLLQNLLQIFASFSSIYFILFLHSLSSYASGQTDSLVSDACRERLWMLCVCVQPVVAPDGEGHMVGTSSSREGSRELALDLGELRDEPAGGGVSTVRYQELWSRSSGHLVRVTASRVDARAPNHTSPFGR